jgi:hypothetical protein
MRRYVAVVAVVATLALSACSSLPSGVDGDLTNDWAAVPAPAPVQPVVGDCYSTDDSNMLQNKPIECTDSHEVEVAAIGQFTGADADASAPPDEGSTPMRTAYGKCDSAAKSYLGDDWHTGLMQLTVAVPDSDAWSGGARWYRCDLKSIEYPDSTDTTTTSKPFKGILAKANPVKLSCVSWTTHSTYISDYRVSSCSSKHEGEYAGLFNSTTSTYPSTTSKYQTVAGDGCETVVAKFLGLSTTKDYNESVGWAWTYTAEARWDLGDRSIRCFAAAFTKDSKFVGSVKGIGLKTAKG